MKNLLLIALLAFTAQAFSSDAGEGDTYKACWLRQNAWVFNLSLERCPGLEKGDILKGIHPLEALLYCGEKIDGLGEVYCFYNGKKILPIKYIDQQDKGTRNWPRAVNPYR